MELFQEAGILFGPAKAANAGRRRRLRAGDGAKLHAPVLDKEEVDAHLKRIMEDLYRRISAAAEEYGRKGDLVSGANIAGFKKVAERHARPGRVLIKDEKPGNVACSVSRLFLHIFQLSNGSTGVLLI